MAKFNDLSNELIIAIGTYIQKLEDILHFTLIDRRTQSLIIPLLYEHINFSHDHDCIHHMYCDDNDHNTNMISRLSNKLRSDSWVLAAEIRSLEFNIHPPWGLRDPDFSFLARTHSLKHLRLFIDYSPIWEASSQVLLSMAGSLETLVIYVFEAGDYDYEAGMGSLRAFTALKSLCIQLPVLVGKRVKNKNVPTISKLLPPNLQKLELHCPTKQTDFEAGGSYSRFGRGELINTSLTTFTGRETKHERILGSVVICICKAMPYGEEPYGYIEVIKSRLNVLGVEKPREDIEVMVRPDSGSTSKMQWLAVSIFW